jgi:hypothetical protein
MWASRSKQHRHAGLSDAEKWADYNFLSIQGRPEEEDMITDTDTDTDTDTLHGLSIVAHNRDT